MKIYIACSLTGAPQKFKIHINNLKKALRKNFEILDWLGLSKGTATDVYRHDTQMVKNCNLLLADCTYPSIGLGFELSLAISLKKSVLAVAHKDAKVSRMVLGINNENYKFERYNSTEDILKLIKEHDNNKSRS